MDDTRLTTIAQLEQCLSANAQVGFAPHGDDAQRYAHISRVLRRFDDPRRTKRERGVVLAYLRHTSGTSRAQLTRLVCAHGRPTAWPQSLWSSVTAPRQSPLPASSRPATWRGWWRWTVSGWRTHLFNEVWLSEAWGFWRPDAIRQTQ